MQTKLIEILHNNDMKYKDLANVLNISEKQVGYKINGKVPFKSNEMFKIRDYFNMKLDDIFVPYMYENGTNTLNKKEE